MSKKVQDILLVDGYNIIFAWEELRKLSSESLENARLRLADMLCNYQALRGNDIILVFDGYKTPGNLGEIVHYHNIDIVYTKEAQTADSFIEALSWQMGGTYNIRVATSDGLEQMIILAGGAARMTAKELRREIAEADREMNEIVQSKQRQQKRHHALIECLPPEVAKLLNEMRLREDD